MRALSSRPPQKIFEKLPLTPLLSLDQNVTGHQFSASSDLVWPPFRSSKAPQIGLILTSIWELRSSGGVVKRGPRRLKIGVQSRFGPNSTVEFEAVFRKKFWGGLASSILVEVNRQNIVSVITWALLHLIVQVHLLEFFLIPSR